MISSAAWLIIGATAGACHVWLLWRAARPPFRSTLPMGPLRLLMVAALFFVAARRHELLQVAASFALAFILGTLLTSSRSSSWRPSRFSKSA